MLQSRGPEGRLTKTKNLFLADMSSTRNAGKGSARRPTDEKKVAANWPENLGPKDGKVRAFFKVYGQAVVPLKEGA